MLTVCVQVQEFLKSEQFSCRTSGRQKCKAQRGIILNAGGPQLVSSAIVSIKVRRGGRRTGLGSGEAGRELRHHKCRQAAAGQQRNRQHQGEAASSDWLGGGGEVGWVLQAAAPSASTAGQQRC